jgi:acetyl-CoA C-acetyltransferase
MIVTTGKTDVRILSSGFARVARGEMPKAPVPAADAALNDAGLNISGIDLIKTHNPFAVNDLYFARETGADLDAMNPYGCSLIYGHPQGPTGARGIVELIHALRERGGGRGLFTGCAAGDTGAALVLEVG